jgi:hypothetical protein
MLGLIVPSLEPRGFALHWIDLLALLGMGSLWLLVLLAIVERLSVRAVPVAAAVSVHG